MAVHDEVLSAALAVCRPRPSWEFSLAEVLAALPHLNASTVRTHVASRCCVNAPKNHPHRWDYFRRLGHGRYEVMPTYRKGTPGGASLAREAAPLPARDTIHAAITHDGRTWTAECLEIAAVTQADSLDRLLASLQEAIALHVGGEDLSTFGLVAPLRLSLTLEVGLAHA